MTYLTEDKLVNFLVKTFNGAYQTNKKLRDVEVNCRPDYVNLDTKLIVEFDGYLHYTQSKTQVKDNIKDTCYLSSGFKVVRWPYFVQVSTDSIRHYLDLDIQVEQVYPHGFHDSKVVFPADFNTLGLVRFYTEMKSLPSSIREEIEHSLHIKEVDKKLLYPLKRENLSILP